MRLVALGVALFAMIGVASAAELRIIVNAPSGGHYIHANILAKHLSKYLTETKITVQSMPGASGLVAMNYVANIAPKDGSVIASVNTRTILSSLFKSKDVKFDVTKLEWIGSASNGRTEPSLMVVRQDQNKLIGGSEASTELNQFRIIKMVTGWNIEEVSGYKDVQDIKLAFDRGEITAVVRNINGIKFSAPDWLTNNNVKPILQFGNGPVRHRSMPNVPTLTELAKSGTDFDMLKLFEAYPILARPFAAPQGTDPERLAVLRHAFWQVFQDAEYRIEIAKFGIEASPISWEECHKIINDIMSSSDMTVRKLQGF